MIWDLIDAISSGEKNLLITTLITALLSLPVVLFSLAFHEAAHAYAAHLQGDRTARYMGRLTLNPAKHLDPLGTVCMVLFKFGWAKPVPIRAQNFKNPKWGMAITALAGPLSNLALSFVGMLLFRGAEMLVPVVCGRNIIPVFYAGMPFSHLMMVILLNLFYCLTYYNAALAIFNLLPIPPLDGSRLAFVFLPDRWYFAIMRYERIIMIVFLVGITTGFISVPIQVAADSITQFFYWITCLFM